MSETREANLWAVGQKRRGVIRGASRKEEEFRVNGPQGNECWAITRLRDGMGLSFCVDWPSTIISDAPEAQPEKPMMSGPGVVPVVGMVVELSCGGLKRTLREPVVGKGDSDTGTVDLTLWRDGGYIILSAPTQQPSPSHVCKGRPCGEIGPGPTSWGTIYRNSHTHPGRSWCSPACRDAWKPEARAACRGKPCGAECESVGPGAAADGWVMSGTRAFCSIKCRDAAGEAAQRHRQPSSAAPSPAPWRCSNVDVGDYDCTTPGAPPQGPVGPRAPQPGGFCVVCYDKLAASITASAKSKFAPEPLATFFLPGSIPVSPHLGAMGGTAGSSWWPKTVEVD